MNKTILNPCNGCHEEAHCEASPENDGTSRVVCACGNHGERAYCEADACERWNNAQYEVGIW